MSESIAPSIGFLEEIVQYLSNISDCESALCDTMDCTFFSMRVAGNTGIMDSMQSRALGHSPMVNEGSSAVPSYAARSVDGLARINWPGWPALKCASNAVRDKDSAALSPRKDEVCQRCKNSRDRCRSARFQSIGMHTPRRLSFTGEMPGAKQEALENLASFRASISIHLI